MASQPFKITEVDLGHIRVGSSHTISFPYSDITVVEMVSPCDCSTPYNDKPTANVRVGYRAKDIPPQLQQKGQTSYPLKKIVRVTYREIGSQENKVAELIFKGTVHK